jgi:hypothetical protein
MSNEYTINVVKELKEVVDSINLNADFLEDLKNAADSINSNTQNLLSLKKSLDASLGDDGGIVISDTDTHTPGTGYEFFAIKALNDIVINSATGNIDDIDGITVYEKDVIFGNWTNLKLTSGSCLAYKKKV